MKGTLIYVCVLESNLNGNGKWKNSATALFQASKNDHAYVCALFLENNVNINRKLETGSSNTIPSSVGRSC